MDYHTLIIINLGSSIKKAIRKFNLRIKSCNNIDEFSPIRIDLIFSLFHKLRLSPFWMIVFSFIFFFIAKVVLNLTFGSAFSEKTLLAITSNDSLVWIKSFDFLVAKPISLDLYYFSDHTDIVLSAIFIPIGMGLMYHTWMKLPLVVKFVYDNKTISMSQNEYLAILQKNHKLFNSYIAKTLLMLLAGLLTALLYTYCFRESGYKWWVREGHIIVKTHYLVTTLVIFYYIWANIYRGIISIILAKDLFRKKINLLLFHQDGCSGLKGIGQLIFDGYYCCVLVGLSFLCFYIFGYIQGIGFLFSFAVYLFFVLIFTTVPMYIIHQKMKSFKEEQLEKFCCKLTETYDCINNMIKVPEWKKEHCEHIHTFVELEHLCARIKKVKTWPFKNDVTLFAGFLYLLQIIGLLLQFRVTILGG